MKREITLKTTIENGLVESYKKLTLCLLHETTIILLGFYWQKIEIDIHKKICMWVFTTALFIKTQNWQPSINPSTGEKLSQVWHIHTMGHYWTMNIGANYQCI